MDSLRSLNTFFMNSYEIDFYYGQKFYIQSSVFQYFENLFYIFMQPLIHLSYQ